MRDIIWINLPAERTREILTETANEHGVTVEMLESKSRLKKIAHARQHAMWRIRKRTKLSLPQIGALLGGRDHTTIIHGIRAHANRVGSPS